jgi:NADPH-dependent 2,4-dienoyl-CoA reductase/sulfur reductase-like enzyme
MRRRSELIGIVDWRVAECERLGVDFRFNAWAEREDVLAEEPDIVIVSTGGLPDPGFLDCGAELVATSWDVLTGDVDPSGKILVYDDNGGHPAMQAAEWLLEAGAGNGIELELLTPERFFAPEMGGLNHVPYARALQQGGATITINRRLLGVSVSDGQLLARIGSDYSDRIDTRRVDAVVVEHGTKPLDELYFSLKGDSINGGEVNYRAMLRGAPQSVSRNPEALFRLYRIGDAVASRSIHAAIYDALRLCKDL